ncbi:MAG TPA: pirin family protein [Oligoflexus sp.]|uniref:pirin family protein n=1 Tax=Oligoflexus sp. TaxID=1971216 RepID=UPI002D7E8D32|nr:pirin family protein [Oligoflexus sp.]HET9237483.1 pirin family protein [Oligoflexus sp.]
MLTMRRSGERGIANHGWLKSRHTFSFGSYVDPKHTNFGPLLVINEDRIEGGSGFERHPHRDMEIISYVVKGSLEHEDTMGNKVVIRPGEVQKMSAGTGVMHSEMNHEKDKETHFFQIWIMPDKKGIKPSYGQKSFATDLEKEPLVLVASGDGRDGSIQIQQDADLYLSRLRPHSSLHFGIRPGRGVWVQVVKGSVAIGDMDFEAGDAASLTDESVLDLSSKNDAELILFDLPL